MRGVGSEIGVEHFPTHLERDMPKLLYKVRPVQIVTFSAIPQGQNTPMPATLASTPLAATAAALRSGQLDLVTLTNEVCGRIDAQEPLILALVPEAGRRTRLLSEAIALQKRFPDPESCPPLYGVLLGVKDIFYVDGFPTRVKGVPLLTT